jgi:hypothetical protein
MAMAPAYPISLEVDAAAPQSRLTVFFRILMVIPHMIALMFVYIAMEIVTLIAWIVILVTGSYPAGMYKFAVGALRWSARVSGYMFLLTGTYPPFSLDDDSSYPIRYHVEERTSGRNRVTVFFRILMAIPQVIVLYFLTIAAEVVLFISWIAALFTGSVPEGMHGFLAGYARWSARLNGYMLLLCDEYPPFSLS